MRTKTLALSALLGMIGSASLVAQTNVYSLNGVGYVTVTIPAGLQQIIACPLSASPNNTLNSIMNNGNGTAGPYTGPLSGCGVTFVVGGENPGYQFDNAIAVGGKTGTPNTNGWSGGGTLALNPGVACWFNNGTANPVTLTFVGQIPQGSLTNTLVPGYNLVSSAVPTSGDLCSNTITALTNFTQPPVGEDSLYMYDPTNGFVNLGIGGIYNTAPSSGKTHGTGFNNSWGGGDPITFAPTQGFYYFNSLPSTPYVWVENFSINP